MEAIKLVLITTKAKSLICTPVQFLLLVRDKWYSPSPITELWRLTQHPFFKQNSLYTWKKCHHKPTVRPLLSVPIAFTIMSKINSVHRNR